MTKKAECKPKKTGLTLTLDPELYQFFSAYAEQERSTMAGILRTYVLNLKRQHQDAEDAFDAALIDARRNEPTIPLDDVLREHGRLAQ